MEKSTKLGIHSSPFWGKFARWIKKKCDEEQIKRIYFFAREGIFFERVFSALFPESDCKVLYVSRLSTFFASLDIDDPNEWKRYTNQYGKETIEAFFCSLDIPVSEIVFYLRKYDLVPSDHINEHYHSFNDLLASDEFKKLLSDKQQKKKLFS